MYPEVKIKEIILADNQFLVSESLKVLIGDAYKAQCKGVASSYELFKMLEKGNIDMIITDFLQFDYNGLEELKMIREDYPDVNILILTNHFTVNDFHEFSKIGIRNVIYKTADKDQLYEAIDATLKGRKYYASEILEMLLEYGDRKNRVVETVQLTVSEKEIIRLISLGLTTKVIADKKNISFHTVMTHRKNIFRKLDINSSSELLLYAIRTGIINTPEYQI